MVADGKVRAVKIYIDDNPVDMLTKLVTTIKFKKCLNMVGVTGYFLG